jgi:hypothetical protein
MWLGGNMTRRSFIAACGATSTATLLTAHRAWSEEKKEAEVGPAEDLMREHGGLNRMLLIYEEGVRRVRDKKSVDLDVLKSTMRA